MSDVDRLVGDGDGDPVILDRLDLVDVRSRFDAREFVLLGGRVGVLGEAHARDLVHFVAQIGLEVRHPRRDGVDLGLHAACDSIQTVQLGGRDPRDRHPSGPVRDQHTARGVHILLGA